MRRAAAIAAGVLALAACKVDVEGAPCAAAGATADCPSGQACGNDGRCSARAATCTRCTPGDSLCADGTSLAKRCTDADPVCGSWEAQDCAARGLACGYRHDDGRAACVCPAGFAGPSFAADPDVGSASGEVPFPNGAPSPPECRFRRLGDAIARAGEVAGPATVQAYRGSQGQTDVVFGDAATGEAVLVVPANVKVVGAAEATSILRFEGAITEPLVTVQGGLDAFRVEGVAATGVGVATTCAGDRKPSLSDVVVDGGGALSAGVDVSGACGAELADVTVSRAAGPALRVRGEAAAPVTVLGGALRESEIGARVTGGDVTFGSDGVATESVEIAANRKEGVVVGPGAATDVRLLGARVRGNGGTGIVVELANAGSAVTIQGCDVSSNGDVAPRTYGPGGSTRSVGGVLVAQGALPLTFAGNRLYANASDQVAFESSAPWAISPGACGPSSNVFACVGAGAYAVAVAGGGTVDARFTVWPDVPFAPYASPGVTGSYCEKDTAGVPSTPACPPP